MPEDFYCRLYVKSDEDEDTLRKKIARYFGGQVVMRSISDEHVHMKLSRNNFYAPDLVNEHGGFVYYPYTAEVHPRHEIVEDIKPVDPEIYLDLVCHIISELRKSGDLVVASCGYEDLVAERTGWNWSEATPNHPHM